MEPKFPKYTPVRHIKDDYKGWIYGTTAMKELFTGNKECDWQYRVKVSGQTRMHIAPEEDLEALSELKELPSFLADNRDPETGFQFETQLHALGYQISGIEWNQRWDILLNVAVPILGVKEVVRTILSLIHARTRGDKARAEKYHHALEEWNRDLDMLLDRFEAHEDLKAKDIIEYVDIVKKELSEFGIINK